MANRRIVGYSRWVTYSKTKLRLVAFLQLFAGTQKRCKIPFYSSETKLDYEIGDLVVTIRRDQLNDYRGLHSCFEAVIVE